MAFACNSNDERFSAPSAENPPLTSTTAEDDPPTEQDVKDVFIKQFGGNRLTFERLQISPTISGYTSNLGVDVHGYPVKVDYTVWGAGYGYRNGLHENGGIYYFHRNEFGDWEKVENNTRVETQF